MKRLMMVMACGLCLFGCASNNVDNTVVEEEDDITYEEWKEQYDEKLRRGRLDSLVTTDEEQAELDRILESSKPHEVCDGISSNDCKKDGNTVEVGLTYSNFKLIGTDNFDTIDEINELLDCKGKLVSESGNYTVYQWIDSENFKIVTVSFLMV